MSHRNKSDRRGEAHRLPRFGKCSHMRAPTAWRAGRATHGANDHSVCGRLLGRHPSVPPCTSAHARCLSPLHEPRVGAHLRVAPSVVACRRPLRARALAERSVGVVPVLGVAPISALLPPSVEARRSLRERFLWSNRPRAGARLAEAAASRIVHGSRDVAHQCAAPSVEARRSLRERSSRGAIIARRSASRGAASRVVHGSRDGAHQCAAHSVEASRSPRERFSWSDQ
jgi:hypothetical protein